MEVFTSLEAVQQPDERMLHYVLYDPTTGESRRQELEDHYEQVASFVLNDSVPNSIQIQFNIAKNVLGILQLSRLILGLPGARNYRMAEIRAHEEYLLSAVRETLTWTPPACQVSTGKNDRLQSYIRPVDGDYPPGSYKRYGAGFSAIQASNPGLFVEFACINQSFRIVQN